MFMPPLASIVVTAAACICAMGTSVNTANIKPPNIDGRTELMLNKRSVVCGSVAMNASASRGLQALGTSALKDSIIVVTPKVNAY